MHLILSLLHCVFLWPLRNKLTCVANRFTNDWCHGSCSSIRCTTHYKTAPTSSRQLSVYGNNLLPRSPNLVQLPVRHHFALKLPEHNFPPYTSSCIMPTRTLRASCSQGSHQHDVTAILSPRVVTKRSARECDAASHPKTMLILQAHDVHTCSGANYAATDGGSQR